MEFSPGYFHGNEIKPFFRWLYKIFGKEKQSAIGGSLITKIDFGLQLHNIFSPLVTICPISKMKIYNWVYGLEDMEFAQGIYDEIYEAERKSINVVYCPISKFIHKVFKNSQYSNVDVYELVKSVVPATRIESRYIYEGNKSMPEFSTMEIDNIPFDLPNLKLITPEHFRDLSFEERFDLALTKRIDGEDLPTLEGITLPSDKLFAEYHRLANQLLKDMGL